MLTAVLSAELFFLSSLLLVCLVAVESFFISSFNQHRRFPERYKCLVSRTTLTNPGLAFEYLMSENVDLTLLNCIGNELEMIIEKHGSRDKNSS